MMETIKNPANSLSSNRFLFIDRPRWRAPLELFPFRFRDPVTEKWQRARYAATLAEISSRYREWEIVGPAEMRSDEPVEMFMPHAPYRIDVAPDSAPTIDGFERFLLRVYLRRYITWCARRRRFAQMQGAVRLFAEC